MAEIDIRGTIVTVDDNDIDLVSQYKWWITPQGYAATKIKRTDGSRRTICMHRVILGDPPEPAIDHINRIRTDNRRCNLRACSHSVNMRNKSAPNYKSQKHRGVSLCKNGKWQVVIRINGALKWLGYHATENDAIAVAAPYFASIDSQGRTLKSVA